MNARPSIRISLLGIILFTVAIVGLRLPEGPTSPITSQPLASSAPQGTAPAKAPHQPEFPPSADASDPFRAAADWHPAAQTAAPLESRATAKLRSLTVLQSEESTNGRGNLLRRYLLQTEEKYPETVLVQELRPGSATTAPELINEVAYAAGHLLGHPAEGESPDAFASRLAAGGLILIGRQEGVIS